MRFFQTILPSPVGDLRLVASDKGLHALVWAQETDARVSIPPAIDGTHEVLTLARQELEAYFEGRLRHFSVPLNPVGTTFQLKAWQALQAIPYGETRTYLEQATLLGNPKAVRAVGAANGRNPISIIVPCHRVIGKNGQLVGFGGGILAKAFLLKHEGVLLL
jgi:methylated-DNA-[protein]-cysteine S-methyltransferase